MADFYKARKPDGKQTVVEFATDLASAAAGRGVALDNTGKISSDFIPAIPGLTVEVRDEGLVVANPLVALDFKGNGVTAVDLGGGIVEVTIPIGQSDIDNLASLITALDGRVTTNEADIITNANGISTNAGNIATNTANIATNDSDISSLEGRVTVNEGDIVVLDTRANDTDTEQGVQDGRLDTLELHPPRTDNPHSVTATQVGLGNVDNTSDLDKPISTATQTALDNKSDVGHTHVEADITDLDKYTQAEIDASQSIQDGVLSDHETRISTNTTNISNNTTAISTNTTNISTLDGRVTINETNISNNTIAIDDLSDYIENQLDVLAFTTC